MSIFSSADAMFGAIESGRYGPIGVEVTIPEGATQAEFDGWVYSMTGDSGGRPGAVLASASPVAFNPLSAGYNPRAVRQPSDAARERLYGLAPAPQASQVAPTSYLFPVLVVTALAGGGLWWYTRKRR